MRDPSGRITHFVAVKEDVTARKLAQQTIARESALNASMARLTQKVLAADSLQQISEQDEHSLRQVYMAQANVIGATCGLIGSPQFTRQCQDFDYVVIDETNLATPPELLLAMMKGKRIILVGDNRNLSPMIGAHFVSQLAEDLGLSEDDVERVGRSYFIEMFKKCPEELCLSLIDNT